MCSLKNKKMLSYKCEIMDSIVASTRKKRKMEVKHDFYRNLKSSRSNR